MIDKELHKGDIIIVETNGKRIYGIIVTNNNLNYNQDQVGMVNISTQTEGVGLAYVDVFTNQPAKAVCNKVWSVWKSDVVEFIRECTTEEMTAIDKALRWTFGLVEPQKKYDITDAAEALQNGAQDALKEHIAKLEEENSDLSCKVHEQTEQITYLNRELEDARKDAELFMQKAVAVKDTAAEVTALTAERDTYKAMYETLLDRMFRK